MQFLWGLRRRKGRTDAKVGLVIRYPSGNVLEAVGHNKSGI